MLKDIFTWLWELPARGWLILLAAPVVVVLVIVAAAFIIPFLAELPASLAAFAVVAAIFVIGGGLWTLKKSNDYNGSVPGSLFLLLALMVAAEIPPGDNAILIRGAMFLYAFLYSIYRITWWDAFGFFILLFCAMFFRYEEEWGRAIYSDVLWLFPIVCALFTGGYVICCRVIRWVFLAIRRVLWDELVDSNEAHNKQAAAGRKDATATTRFKGRGFFK